MLVNEKTFCIGPWSEIRISPEGKLNYCHRSAWPKSGDMGYDDHIANLDLDNYFHGRTTNCVRNQLLNGNPVLGCGDCYSDETKIDFSFRRRRNIQMAIFPGKDFEKSFKESSFFDRISKNYKPLFYNISLTNLCNLGCVMCNETWSSKLGSEFRRIGIHQSRDSKGTAPVLSDWSRDPVVWEKFMHHILSNEQIVCVHFQGGEPFLHRRLAEFVDRCIQHDHVDYHFTTVTNGTIYNDDLIEKLKRFRSVQIEISIENLSKSNEYVRYPSTVDAVLENIKKYLNHRSEKFDVVIRTVPQLLTVLDYAPLLEFCLESQLVVDSNIIQSPVFFSSKILPLHLKNTAKSRIENFISKHDFVSNSMYDSLNLRNSKHVRQSLIDNARMVLTELTQDIPTDADQLIDDCRQYLYKIDCSRKIRLQDYCPEIADWLYDV